MSLEEVGLGETGLVSEDPGLTASDASGVKLY
jgi:hypothetical protein